MNVGSLFSGDGLLDYGLTLAGWDHGFLCESEPDRRAILSLRWPGVPIFEDVRDVDGFTPRVDLLAGGFPCRGASTAGLRTGLDHPETALWREFARIIGDLRPRLVLVENVANLLAVRDGGAWAEVVGDLASLGYVFAWDCLPAAAFGAPHLRDRVFAVAALADGAGEQRNGGQRQEQNGRADAGRGDQDAADPSTSRWRTDERDLRPGQPDAPGQSAPNPQRNGVRQQPEPERGSSGARELAEAGSDAADADRSELSAGRYGSRGHGVQAHPRGVAVDWGDYEPAIRRWEEVHGPAPEPLLRGVDARPARRVVRSRLSALGDGVQVQAGQYLGERLMELAG